MNTPLQFVPRMELEHIPIIIGSSCARISATPNGHMHDHTELWYVLSGTARHIVDGREYIQTKGSCIVVFPFTPHTYDTTESDESPILFCIDFDDKAVTSHGADYFSYYNKAARYKGRKIPVFRSFEAEDKENADSIARAMLSEYDKNAEMSLDRLSSLLINFLDLLCRDMPVAEKPGKIEEHSKFITAAVRHIAKNYTRSIPLDELCLVACMSRSRFTHAFKLVCGITSGEMLLLLRIRRAMLMLCFDSKPLDEIAKEVGLYDKSRLSRVFTAYYGISPSAYKKSEALTAQRMHFDTMDTQKRRREIISSYKKKNQL